MKIVFMGTPEFAAIPLQALIDENFSIVAAYTQPPRPAGRGYEVKISDVHKVAENNNIEVYTPKNFKSQETIDEVRSLNADIAIVAAYGLILPKAVLDSFKYGCINIHASILPRWRGAAPIQHSILAGDTKTGITIMQMDESLDTGGILYIEEININSDTTGGSLHDEMCYIGAKMIVKAMHDLADNNFPSPQKQIGETCYASKIHKNDALIDFTKDVSSLDCFIRAYNPYPAAFFKYNGEVIKIHHAECAAISHDYVPGTIIDDQFSIACMNGIIKPKTVQRAGKKSLTISEFLRGFKFNIGDVV